MSQLEIRETVKGVLVSPAPFNAPQESLKVP